MPRPHIHLFINGRPHRVTGADVFLSLSDYLRLARGLIGTKIVCSEGDCGACSVLLARLEEPGRPDYRAIDACITWMFQLDHTHVVTVEGLGGPDALHPVQQAMIDCHGSQCGFCTPGFVVALAGMADAAKARGRETLGDDEVRLGLTGNLCRCTGYVQIIQAARSCSPGSAETLAERYPVEPMRAAWEREDPSVRVAIPGGREVAIPATVREAVEYLSADPATRVVGGATDLGVAINKGLAAWEKVMYAGRLAELTGVTASDGVLTMGAATTWSQVHAAIEESLPAFAEILALFGSPQVRNAGTVGGNIINASPIADSLPLLFVTDARLRLVGRDGERWIDVKDFHLGYKKLDLRPGELLAQVQLTLPGPGQELRLYKVSRRRDLDIATFTAAVLLTLDDATITGAKLAYGGVGPVVLRLPRTERFLAGKQLSESVMAQAGVIARGEVSSISDVRASADYRAALAETILTKAYFDLAPGVGAAASSG